MGLYKYLKNKLIKIKELVIIKMSRENENLSPEKKVAIGAVVAGIGYLLYKLLQVSGDKEKHVYKCSNCGLILTKKYLNCPRCGAHILWKPNQNP